MIRQHALRWAVLLPLVATLSLAPLPARFAAPVTPALAQGDAADAGETADLAIAALHCAGAPATEALTAFFTSGVAPSGCSPAVGVTISVSEHGAPVSGSPATTGTDGITVLPVTLGSALEVHEDPTSLPSGYEPLTREANGVPYANPVRIDSTVAGAAVLFVNVPHAVASGLAQAAPDETVGEAADLAVVALQCAAAPTAETLTSFFSAGTPPGGCAPAEGVGIAITENGQPLPGSPFTTGANGVLSVPVGLGSTVSVTEDAQTLPPGYQPLTQAANGVPYANPVKLDPVTAGTAALFVNVPASVAATLAEDTLAVDGGGGATTLAQGVTPDRTGCDPAYPDARTCIAPGPPLAAPCAITDQRNFTVLAPDPRGLDADHDGIGCEPIAPGGGTALLNASVDRPSGGGAMPGAAAAGSGVPVAASRARSGTGARDAQPASRRAHAATAQRDHGRAGLWFAAPARAGNVAIASNPVFIANGLWGWPSWFTRNDEIWRTRNPGHDGVINIGNVTVTGHGSGNVAIASNPVVISSGAWAWPGHGDDWRGRDRVGNSAGFWPTSFTIGNVTVAGSGSGNIAIASNPVVISGGVWHWPGHLNAGGWPWHRGQTTGHWRWPNHAGHGVWGRTGIISIGNLVIARSGNNIALVSNPVVIIASGLWYVPPGRQHDDGWPGHGGSADAHLMQTGAAPAAHSGGAAQAIDAGGAGDAPTSETELLAASTQPALTINGGLAIAPAPADALQPPGDAAVASPTEGGQAASGGDVALPGDGTVAAPGEGTVAAPLDTAAPSQAGGGAPDPVYVAPEPAVDPAYVDPGYVAQEPIVVDAGTDAGYVAPAPSYVDPAYVDAGTVDTGDVAPDPGLEPIFSAPQPSPADRGGEGASVAPEPVAVAPAIAVVAPEPGFVDPGNGAANPGLDTGFGGQAPASIAPAANVATPGMGSGPVDAGNARASAMAPDSGMQGGGNGDPGGVAVDAGGDGGG